MKTSIAVMALLLAVFNGGSRMPVEAADQEAKGRVEGGLASAAAFQGRSLRFLPATVPPPAKPAESPVSLTATDGTGLALTGLKASAAVEGPLAFTELHLTFTNPQDRVIEGQFRILLPPGAAISRFAMKLGEKWQEGEVVERQKARAAYEDFLHRRQDPALLEAAAGNEFSARVFPIPAKGIKEILLSYSQEMPRSGAPFVLPLRGLPEVGELVISAHSGGALIGSLSKRRVVPAADFTAALPAGRQARGARHGALVLARVRPLAEPQPDEIASLLILLDTSASRALVQDEQLRLLERLAGALARGAGAGVPLRVAAFDQSVEEVYAGTAGGFGEEALRRIRRRRALGASDLQAALRWARTALTAGPAARVLLLTDGVATAGALDGETLAAEAVRLKTAGVERLDAVVLGGLRDEALLKRIVTAGLPRDGVVADGGLEPGELARKLTQATRSDLAVEVEGSAWSWPKMLDGVQPGDEVMVYAEIPEGRPFKVKIGGRPAPVESPLLEVEKPLVQRAWAQAKILSLLARLDRADGEAAKAKLSEEIVTLSEQHRVLSPLTALLVLETEQDYVRYGIDRKALADLLVIRDGRAALAKRGEDSIVIPERPPRREPPADHAKSALARMGEDTGAVQGGPSVGEAPGMDEGFASSMEEAAPEPAFGGAGGTGAMPTAAPTAPGRLALSREIAQRRSPPGSPPPPRPGTPSGGADPYEGKFKEVLALLARGQTAKAASAARAWQEESPGDLLALVALGEALEAAKDFPGAARAYGSIIDLFPTRADLRRFAGERLERLQAHGLALAVDTFRKARESRPDHPSSHRLYSFALLRQGRHQEAFEALAEGLARKYPEGRFRSVDRVLREDLGLLAAAWIKAEPGRRDEVLGLLRKAGGTAEGEASLRFVLVWETDANDVDFHIKDGKGGHAFYSEPRLASGGELYADVTTGYGPECFTIRGARDRRAYPYTLQAHYYSRGPMGFGMGKLEILEHDGKGGLTFLERPFVIMTDGAFVDLGRVAAK